MIAELLQGKECFLDIGAHLGWYTCLAAKIIPNGIVYAFEMDDLNYSLLKKNLLINNCSNVEAINMAVSDSTSVVGYKRIKDRPSPEFRIDSRTKKQKIAEYVTVNSIKIDDFFEIKELIPDIIKIDVEGAEMKVLRGMKRILYKYKPILFLEIHPANLHDFNTSTYEIFSFLIRKNYKLFKIEHRRDREQKKRFEMLVKYSEIKGNTMIYAIKR